MLESAAIYKKMIEDSIREAQSLIEENQNLLKQINGEIKEKTKKLDKMQ